MKFSEDLLKQLDISPTVSKEPVNVIKVREALSFIEQCASRINDKSNTYINAHDADIEIDCIDIVTSKLNDFVQAFKDIIIFMRINEGTYDGNGQSLRYAVTSYDTFNFSNSSQAKQFLNELLLRNEITHDYFNREIHQQKLIGLMENYAGGALEIYKNIYEYCEQNNLLEKYLDKNAR